LLQHHTFWMGFHDLSWIQRSCKVWLSFIYNWIPSFVFGFTETRVGFDCSVRVSNELGARNPKSASFSVVVVTVISFIISVIIAVVLLSLRDVISYAFTEGEEVAAAVSDLCPLLALSIVLNGIQPVLSGITTTSNSHLSHLN